MAAGATFYGTRTRTCLRLPQDLGTKFGRAPGESRSTDLPARTRDLAGRGFSRLLDQCHCYGGKCAFRPRTESMGGACARAQRWPLGECGDLSIRIANRPSKGIAMCVVIFPRVVGCCPIRLNSGQSGVELDNCSRDSGSDTAIVTCDAGLPARSPGVSHFELS